MSGAYLAPIRPAADVDVPDDGAEGGVVDVPRHSLTPPKISRASKKSLMFLIHVLKRSISYKKMIRTNHISIETDLTNLKSNHKNGTVPFCLCFFVKSPVRGDFGVKSPIHLLS